MKHWRQGPLSRTTGQLTRQRLYRVLIWLTATATFTGSPANATEAVRMSLRLAPPNQVEVRYTLPQGCKEVAFNKRGKAAALIRSSWQAENSCAAADGQTLRNIKGCDTLVFRVPTNTDKVSGYPAAFPVADAVYVHTSNYSLEDTCGPVQVSLHAAAIAAQGKVYAHELIVSGPESATIAALLLPTPHAQGETSFIYMDPALGAATLGRITEVAQQTIEFFRAEMPSAPFKMPALVASKVNGPGGVRFDGDASDVLRLALINWPQDLSPVQDRTLTRFVSHEFSHRFQLRDAVDAYPASRVIHEGGAEFMRWLLAVKRGWLSKDEAAQELNGAVGECLMGTRGLSWGATPSATKAAQRLEYSCGLAIYAFGLAANPSVGPTDGGSLQRIADFYQRLGRAETPDFFQALECGASAECSGRWLPRLLGDAEGMDTVWSAFFAATGLAKAVAPNRSQAQAMVREFLGQLMTQDCGASSWFFGSELAEVDSVGSCKTLRGGMVVRKAQGHALFDGMPTLNAMVEACRMHGQLELELASGTPFAMPCTAAYRPLRLFYAVDIDRLLSRL